MNAEKCKFFKAYFGKCDEWTRSAGVYTCDKHFNVKCVQCNRAANHECDVAMQLVCGTPLCASSQCINEHLNSHYAPNPPGDSPKQRGYHLAEIPKGVLGEFSKIEEEFLEAKDAFAQGVDIMLMVELSDLYGAIEAFVAKRGFTMKDLSKMKERTEAAFKSGRR